MTNATDQDMIEESARQIVADGLVVLANAVNQTDADPELVLKIVTSKIADIGKTVPVKSVDPLAGLPVVHIHIGSGVRVEATPLPLVEIVEDGPELLSPLPAETLSALASALELLPP
jgi:hypothetical protein